MSMLLAGPMLSSVESQFPTSGLIAHYTMDSISGSTLVDETGNYDASIVGTLNQVSGISGFALDFPNGSGNYFDTGIVNFSPPGVTISQWINFDAINASVGVYPSIHSSRKSSTGVSGIFTYQASASDSATGNAAIRPHINTGSGLVSFDTAFIPIVSSWFHLCITYDGTLRAYINGVEDANSGVSGGSIAGTTNSLWFGECRREAGFNGKMDITRIYNRALSSGEVLQLYNEV